LADLDTMFEVLTELVCRPVAGLDEQEMRRPADASRATPQREDAVDMTAGYSKPLASDRRGAAGWICPGLQRDRDQGVIGAITAW
jgi:hypothetical protein